MSLSKQGKKSKAYQLTSFEVGQVKAHLEHGLTAAAISKRIFKRDGKTTFGETAITNCISKLQGNPRWRGERQGGSGRPRKTTAKQDKEIVKWVLKNRGKVKVSARQLKKQFRYLRPLSDTLVEERLHDAELAYLRRRSKSKVTKQYLAERVTYCEGVKRKRGQSLLKWAYTDGTTFFVDRTDDELEQSQTRALGTHVWRRSDNKDAMFQDCLGPSSYSKGQGTPVRVWGMLACGALHIHVLEEGEVMNQQLYAELIEDRFEQWCGFCEYLVCDYERCLRSAPALHALSKTPLQLVEPYPRVSQDFNAIENAWGILKKRLSYTMPTNLEGRDDFIKRLKVAVKWMNEQKSEQLWKLSTNQKKRAGDCLAMTPPGGRTTW